MKCSVAPIFLDLKEEKHQQQLQKSCCCRKHDEIEFGERYKHDRIDECIIGTKKLIRSEFNGPVNIGSEEMIAINDLAKMVISISNKKLKIRNVPGPEGVRGRNSDNALIERMLHWSPEQPLFDGVEKTYHWINEQLHKVN